MKVNSNYSLNFSAIHKRNIETSNASRLAYLNHTSHFFRYAETDEFLINLFRNSNKKEINIASAGCSYGEEVYSYAIGLTNKDTKINGFDISEEAIEHAKIGKYELDEYEMWYLNPTYKQRKAQEYALPLRDILRKNFHNHFKKITKTLYQLKPKSFKNCNFFVGNIKKTGSYFKETSQDLILCRNVLYHLPYENRKDVIAQFYSILKPEGLICLDSDTFIESSYEMKKQGFITPYPDKPWIFQKPKKKLDIEDIILNHQIEKLINLANNKSDFNNI